MEKKEFDIVGIGVSTIDILNLVDHFPADEEVQKSIAQVIDGGGPVASAIAAASRLGARTAMIDIIGDDWIGEKIISGFKEFSVDTNRMLIEKGKSSSIATVLVRKNDGARTIVYSPGNARELRENDIPEELITKSEYVHMNGRHITASLHAAKLAKLSGCKISFDGGAHRYNKRMRELVPLADILIASKNFVDEYTGTVDLALGAKIFLDLGIQTIVITDGLTGSWYFSPDVHGYHQKAFINEDSIDTTGCGDCYHGAFLFALSQGMDYKNAMRLASGAASLNTRSLGGRKSLPNYEEVKRFLAAK